MSFNDSRYAKKQHCSLSDGFMETGLENVGYLYIITTPLLQGYLLT
jgi:hypothetical protein